MHKNNKEKAKLLLERYQNGTATSDEEKIIQHWFDSFKGFDQIEQLPRGTGDEVHARILAYIEAEEMKKRKIIRLWKYAAAVSVVLIAGIWGSFYFSNPLHENTEKQYALENDVLPGGNEARLILEDGSVLQLDETNETDYHIPGLKIDQKQGIISFVDYSSSDDRSNPRMNTIETDNGGQYIIILPDSSTVKLNANSSLRFPSSFSSTRQVALRGEAYFDVKRNESARFIVDAGFQKVEVLGTQFNVKSYAEENITTTALVSGSLKVTSTDKDDEQVLILKPGDMAKNGLNNGLVLHRIKTNKVKAWQEGEFHFDGENLEEIMTIIARWYDVKVVYEHKPAQDIQYGGVISRNKKLSTVLNLLGEKEKLRFEIKGKEVIVKR